MVRNATAGVMGLIGVMGGVALGDDGGEWVGVTRIVSAYEWPSAWRVEIGQDGSEWHHESPGGAWWGAERWSWYEGVARGGTLMARLEIDLTEIVSRVRGEVEEGEGKEGDGTVVAPDEEGASEEDGEWGRPPTGWEVGPVTEHGIRYRLFRPPAHAGAAFDRVYRSDVEWEGPGTVKLGGVRVVGR